VRSRLARTLLVLMLVVAATVLARAGTTHAFPPAGTDQVPVSAQASITSRLGQETITFTGTVSIQRSAPYISSGVSVVDVEIVALSLTGNSLTGPVTVAESGTLASTGEIRSWQPGADYPAGLFLDAFVVLDAPASPSPTITLHNNAALHLVPMLATTQLPIGSWPPYSIPLKANPSPCVPLLPAQPKSVCVNSLTVTFGSGGGDVGGLTELPLLDRSSDSGSGLWLALAAIATGVVALGGGGWLGRREPRT